MSDYYQCVVCDKDVPDYEPVMCCNGRECGCYGLPVEPCVCSQKCWDVLINRAFMKTKEAEK